MDVAKNVEKGEQVLRVILGLIALVFGIWFSGGVSQWVLALLGVFLWATAFIGY